MTTRHDRQTALDDVRCGQTISQLPDPNNAHASCSKRLVVTRMHHHGSGHLPHLLCTIQLLHQGQRKFKRCPRAPADADAKHCVAHCLWPATSAQTPLAMCSAVQRLLCSCGAREGSPAGNELPIHHHPLLHRFLVGQLSGKGGVCRRSLACQQTCRGGWYARHRVKVSRQSGSKRKRQAHRMQTARPCRSFPPAR